MRLLLTLKEHERVNSIKVLGVTIASTRRTEKG